MPTTAHKNLTGVDLHEPKGVAAATSGQVYRADGAGSGSWQTLSIPTGLFRVALTSFTSTGTWTKPANLFKVRVHVTAEGGKCGANGGTNGSTASFGAHCSATGGQGSLAGAGTGSGGDINIQGYGGAAVQIGAGGSAGGPWFPYGKGQDDSDGTATAGSGGGYAVKEILDASLASTVAVTIGATGAANGFVVVEEYITV